ncbi:MHO_1580 family protein [[Mycoplasma] gypis]|uniref:Uncharacterized protein n=1 Tax=[Mycoplasma] gypis TaxID=92404 RepID=A0ABZ2RNS6_9BACT|nr:hypothetical protein [[Mycoplasma] gypis]MBN0919315.1 hypothetical protein [[Mycoplasma] gypis]
MINIPLSQEAKNYLHSRVYKENKNIKISSSKKSDLLSKHDLINFDIVQNMTDGKLYFEVNYYNSFARNFLLVIIINGDPLPVYESRSVLNKIKFYSGQKIDAKKTINNYKITVLNTISFNLYSKNNLKTELLWKVDVDFLQEELKKDFIVPEEGMYFEIPKKISLHLNPSNYEITNSDSFNENYHEEIKIQYARIGFIPTKLSQIQHNKTIFFLTGQVISDQQFIKKITPGEINNLNIKTILLPNLENEKVEVGFNPIFSNQKINNEPVIGEIVILSDTFYDYYSEKTKLGINSNSKQGYVIPYNFRGDILISTIINLDNFLHTNIILSYRQNFSKPLLNEDYGYINLKIEEDIESNNAMNWLKIKNADFYLIYKEELTLDTLVELSKKYLRSDPEDEIN